MRMRGGRGGKGHLTMTGGRGWKHPHTLSLTSHSPTHLHYNLNAHPHPPTHPHTLTPSHSNTHLQYCLLTALVGENKLQETEDKTGIELWVVVQLIKDGLGVTGHQTQGLLNIGLLWKQYMSGQHSKTVLYRRLGNI